MALLTSEEIAEIQALLDSLKEHIQDGSYVKVSGTLKRIFDYEIHEEDETKCDCLKHDTHFDDVESSIERRTTECIQCKAPMTPMGVRYDYARFITVEKEILDKTIAWLNDILTKEKDTTTKGIQDWTDFDEFMRWIRTLRTRIHTFA